MTEVPTLLMKGLAEGLVLATLEATPTHAFALIDELERLLGRAPNKNQVYPLVRDLRDEGLVDGEEETVDGRKRNVLSLTEAGRARLAAYRDLPDAFGAATDRLFSGEDGGRGGPRPPAAGDGSSAASGNPSQVPPSPPGDGSDAWVEAAVTQLPTAASVQAPFAQVSLNRNPGSKAWVLEVQHHEPGAYPGAEACPLTFLYEASKKLLFGGPAPQGEPGGEPAVAEP